MKRLIILLLLLFVIRLSFSQKTIFHSDIETEFRAAHELFLKEKYGAAKKKFSNIVALDDDKHSEITANASYYSAVCAVMLFNNDAELLLKNFISSYPEHAFTNMAYFHLGTFYYSKRSYSNTLKAFRDVDTRSLSAEQLAEYHFKIGYSYFVRDDYESASKSFFEIINANTKYTVPANYYFAHIAYHNSNWETAQRIFLKLKDDPHFGTLVPYYIVHIYFMQGRYEELLKEAPQLLEKADETKAPEINRFIGEAHFKLRNFKEALIYLNNYAEKINAPLSREDKYQLAYCYYKIGDYNKAITFLTDITGDSDSLTQNANYILADSYLKTNQLQFARNAFQAATRDNYDKSIHQSALLNYAKLSYQLSFNPYNDAVIALMTYIDTYPNAEDIDEVNRLLVNVFFATKNYKAAIESIEKIKFKTHDLQSAYQKLAFLRGVELFNNRDYSNAVALFNKSFTYVLNPDIFAQSLFWKSEAFYRINRFDSAEVSYNKFLLSQGAFQLEEYNLAHYNLGYAYFKQKKYNLAISSFRRFVASPRSADPKIINDAFVRIGDAYYVTKDYSLAIDFYNRAINAGAADTDYAMYQKAVCSGVLARFEDKSNTLLELIKKYPNSSFIIDARYELGNTYLAVGDNENALIHFRSIINNHPTSSYKVHAMLKTGLINFNKGDNDAALDILKKVVSDYPGTSASNDALISIRDIYVNINRSEDFFVYVKNIPSANISESEQDSITYLSVQNQYMKGNCESALKGFRDYIDKYQDGIFVIDAHFYMAECLNRVGRFNEALSAYAFVLSKHRTKFTESSLVKAAAINFQLKNYNEAIRYFADLEKFAEIRSHVIDAQIGQMRSHYFLNNYDKAIEAATKITQQEKIDIALIQEARLTMGKAFMGQEKTSHAQAEFLAATRIAETEMKAEAKYFLALIQYNLGNFKESEKIIFEIINEMPSYNYWIAKGFILLADNLVALGNIFQAKHTLQSIIDNYDDSSDLVQIAFEKLNAIIEQEKAEEKEIVEPDIFEINY